MKKSKECCVPMGFGELSEKRYINYLNAFAGFVREVMETEAGKKICNRWSIRIFDDRDIEACINHENVGIDFPPDYMREQIFLGRNGYFLKRITGVVQVQAAQKSVAIHKKAVSKRR